MLILGIDTSGKSGGITLAQGDRQSFCVLESAPIAGGTFSAQMIPTIAALLEKHGFTASDVGGFAVLSGPGSFTGLRVGLGGVKGLAEVLGAPIATVSLLEAIAANVLWAGQELESHPVCRVVVDAGRGEIFLGEYECLYEPGPKVLSESLTSISELAKRVDTGGQSYNLVTPDAGLVESLRHLVGDPHLVCFELIARPTSEDVARLGLRKLLVGQTVSVEALDANYIRRSDAEIFSKGPR